MTTMSQKITVLMLYFTPVLNYLIYIAQMLTMAYGEHLMDTKHYEQAGIGKSVKHITTIFKSMRLQTKFKHFCNRLVSIKHNFYLDSLNLNLIHLKTLLHNFWLKILIQKIIQLFETLKVLGLCLIDDSLLQTTCCELCVCWLHSFETDNIKLGLNHENKKQQRCRPVDSRCGCFLSHFVMNIVVDIEKR